MVCLSSLEKYLGCPGQPRKILNHVDEFLQKNKSLPPACDKCFTVVVSPSEGEEDKLRRMIVDCYAPPSPFPERRPYANIYFRVGGKSERDGLINELREQLEEYGITGEVVSQKHCKWAEGRLIKLLIK